MIKIVICDDMQEDRENVLKHLNSYLNSRGIEAEIRVFDHPDKMIEECEKFRPDIYILDIVMPMITGIQAARELRWNQPDAEIIFTTSEKSYALESFDVNPLNYIVKPVEEKKLHDTLDMAFKRVEQKVEKSVCVKVRGGFSTILLNDIMYIDYRNHVVSYHLADGEVISTPTLRIGFSEYLANNHDDRAFVQCHESVSVYIPSIDKLTKTDIVVRNKEIIPVSKSRYAKVAESYMDYRMEH